MMIAALVGCNNEKPRALLNERSDQASQGIQEAKTPAPPKTYNPLAITDKVWAGSSSLRLRRGMPLPARYEGPHGVTLVSSDPMQLNDIANTIGGQIGIPVRIAAGTAGSSGGGSSPSGSGMSLAYEGPLSGLLEYVASYYGVNWRYDGSSINFSRFETRVFIVESLPGTQSIKDGVKDDQDSGGGGSGGSSGGSSGSTSSLSQSAETTIELKAWDELKDTVVSMLGGVGSVVTAPSSGTLTVTTTPEIMRTVAKFIEQENQRSSRQVAINVDIYKVELAEGTDFSFSFSQFLSHWKNLQSTYASAAGVTMVTGSPMNSTGGTSATAGTLTTTILPEMGGGVQTIMKALSSIGDTSRVAQFPMTTLNNKPVSRRVGRDRSYVASIQNTTVSGTTSGSVSSTITPGTVREGFNLQLTPRILEDGRILLQYSLSLTDIVTVRTMGTVDSSGNLTNGVQLPETASRVFAQQSLLKSGSTLVLAGLDDEQVAQDSTGVGNPFNLLLGGNSSNETTHTMMFIAITPQVLEVPHAEHE